MKKAALAAACANYLLLFASVFCFGQTNFARGEELFMKNSPSEALVFLENSIVDDPGNVKAYLYLGIVYEQLDRADEAIAVYRRIMPRAGNLTAQTANNLGNVYFKRGNTEEALQFYNTAIESDMYFPSAYLGRANAKIKAGLLRDALSDYDQYLFLERQSPQRARIVELMDIIRAELASEERMRMLAEEEERLRAEQRQRLLDEISSSLQAAVDSSQGLSSGAEDVEGYTSEFELE
ncbi:MAG: tetratricopeptide repeat protein [Treponema sp.]|nr:tetratricopeptide repeat protein [Treponema sp.]